MNAKVKGYKEATCSIDGGIADAIAELNSLRDELQEWYDNLPENFQNGDRGSTLQDAIGELDSCCDEPTISDALLEHVSQVHVSYLAYRRSTSRAKRRDDAVAMLRAIGEWLSTQADELEATGEEAKEDLSLEMNELATQVEEMADYADAAEFPGMYG